MKQQFREILEECPVITAANDDESLEACFEADSQIVFILYGDILRISSIVRRVKEHGKTAMVHADLIYGLDTKEIAVDYLAEVVGVDGIISTKTNLINRARELGLYTVYRFFAIDSRSLANIRTQCRNSRPDCVEILPGVMPQIIKKIVKENHVPVIAGGMIAGKEDIYAALDAGATAVSTTRQELWFA